jgi:hypothetical protein
VSHYQTLGLHQDASAHAIKTAYRKLVKIYHPDRGADLPAGAEDKMRKINEAYAVLSKSDKRRRYDESLKVSPKPFSHPTGEGGATAASTSGSRPGGDATGEHASTRPAGPRPQQWKTRGEELHEEVHSPGFLKRFRTEYSNRLESKDAFLAVVVAFFFMMKQPSYFASFGNLLVSWPFFLAALIAAIGARFSAGIYAAHRFKSPLGLGVIVISNGAAAIALGWMARVIEGFLQQELFAFPLVPALLATLLPAAIGAGMGRAINRSVDPFYGMFAGAFVGVVLAVFFGLWAVLAQVVVLGAGATSADSATLAKPLKAVMIASAIAGGVGSFRVNYLFIFSIFDWIESWFERFRPVDRVESSALSRRD